MISAFDRTSSHDWTDDVFLVRYNGRYAAFYMARTLPIFALFTVLTLLYLDDQSRRAIFSRYGSIHKPFSWPEFSFLLVFMMAPILDLVLTLMRVGRGKTALSISPEGITGAVVHMTRLLKWDDIADVTVDGKFLVVRRQPRSLIQTLFGSRGLSNINVPAHHLDHDVQKIVAAVRRLKPPEHSSASAF